MAFAQLATNGLKRAVKQVEQLQKQARFAQAVALTKSAQAAKNDLTREVESAFEKPTAYTRNSIYMQSASKKVLESKVGVKNLARRGTSPAEYLSAQVFGGQRELKPFAKVLQSAGLMPKGKFLVLGPSAPRNGSGNMSLAQFKKILRGLRSRSSASGGYFVGTIKGTQGVWLRRGKRVRLILMFVDSARYRKRFEFFELAKKGFERRFVGELREAVANAFHTAR